MARAGEVVEVDTPSAETTCSDGRSSFSAVLAAAVTSAPSIASKNIKCPWLDALSCLVPAEAPGKSGSVAIR